MKDATNHESDRLRIIPRTVLLILRESREPLSAYQILDKADSTVLKNPVQIYRALKVLIDLALAHRVETLNKYVACRCDHPKDLQPVLTICDDCGAVAELPELPSIQQLEELLNRDGFMCRMVKVEVAGLCLNCQAETSL